MIYGSERSVNYGKLFGYLGQKKQDKYISPFAEEKKEAKDNQLTIEQLEKIIKQEN